MDEGQPTCRTRVVTTGENLWFWNMKECYLREEQPRRRDRMMNRCPGSDLLFSTHERAHKNKEEQKETTISMTLKHQGQ
jgi:hypothetical protein